MAQLDYRFVQGLIDFGRTLASNIVGQPFAQYRLSTLSTGNVLDGINQINNLNAKVTRTTSAIFIENSYFSMNVFQFLVAAGSVNIGDILVQQDLIYGQNTQYAVASFRPLKPVLCVKVDSLSQIYRLQSNSRNTPGGYGGVAIKDQLPFTLINGIYTLGQTTDTPSNIPVGIVSTAQIRGLVGQVERLPLDTMRALWFIYLPALPGLSRLLPGDVVHGAQSDSHEKPQRYAIQNAMNSVAGLEGTFYNAELLIP